MNDETNQATPPDWHPDPHDPSRLRYWDGSQWTDQTADAPATEVQSLDDTHWEPGESTKSESSGVPAPLEAVGPLPRSVQGWKPVRRKRIDDRLALRKGAIVGLSVATTAWFLIASVRYLSYHREGGKYFSYNLGYFILSNSNVGPVPVGPLVTVGPVSVGPFVMVGPDSVGPFVMVGLCIAALVAGWLVAMAATNPRAELSACAASGSVFAVSLVIPLLTLFFLRSPAFRPGGFFIRNVWQIVTYAGVSAVLALPFGIIGWLIGRPRPLSVAATASLNLSQSAASDELLLVLSGMRNQRLERPTLSTVSLRVRFFPGWAILLSLLLFPLGILAAIAAQREETGTIILNEAGKETSTLQVRGLFDEAACTRIEAFLKQHAASKELS